MKAQSLNLLLIVSLVACSHKPKNHDDYERFTTYIDQQGVKQFQFSAMMPDNHKKRTKGSQSQGKDGSGSGRRGGGQFVKPRSGAADSSQTKQRNKQRMMNKLYARLEHQLNQAGYCRAGFIETDQFSEAGGVFIEGRCHDKATAEDRVKFQNQ